MIAISILRKQPEIKGFWAGPPHQQGPGPGPRHGRPQPCPGGIGAPLPGTRIPRRLREWIASGMGSNFRSPAIRTLRTSPAGPGAAIQRADSSGPWCTIEERTENEREIKDRQVSRALRPAQAAPVRRTAVDKRGWTSI